MDCTGHVHVCLQVVLHGKTLPWFVSDTLLRDLYHLLSVCEGSSGLPVSNNVTEDVMTAVKRWRDTLTAAGGALQLRVLDDAVPFWWMEQVRDWL